MAEIGVSIKWHPGGVRCDGQRPAILRRTHHLAGGRVAHHFLLHRRDRLLFPGRACPEAGCGQNQTAQDREAGSKRYVMHSITPITREYEVHCRPSPTLRAMPAIAGGQKARATPWVVPTRRLAARARSAEVGVSRIRSWAASLPPFVDSDTPAARRAPRLGSQRHVQWCQGVRCGGGGLVASLKQRVCLAGWPATPAESTEV